MPHYLIILETGERKKLQFKDGTYEELLRNLRTVTAFHPETTLIQIFDEDVEDFIDIDPDDMVQDKAKIKVIRKREALCEVPQNKNETRDHFDVSDSTQHSSAIPQPSVMASVPLVDKNDYLKFVLPDFKHWESVISKGTPISGKARRYIVSQLFQECFRITWYPSQRLYCRSVDLLLEKYPHLRDCTDENGQQAWIEQLSNKFRNMRRKASTAAVKIQEMRDKFGTKRPNTQAQQRNKKLCRLHNQEHLIVYGETEESLAKHQQWLATTSSASVDPAHYRERLLATAKERHETLMTMTLTDALAMFPFLASETALLMEFEILWKRDLKKLLELGLNTVCTIIMRFGKEEELISLSETFSADEVLAGLQCIASRCSEKLQMITEGSPSLAPCLVQTTDEINLYVDGQRLFKVSSILTGVCCIFAAFWVFNIRYPKESRNTLTFLERALFGLSETKVATKCRDLLNFYMFYKRNV